MKKITKNFRKFRKIFFRISHKNLEWHSLIPGIYFSFYFSFEGDRLVDNIRRIRYGFKIKSDFGWIKDSPIVFQLWCLQLAPHKSKLLLNCNFYLECDLDEFELLVIWNALKFNVPFINGNRSISWRSVIYADFSRTWSYVRLVNGFSNHCAFLRLNSVESIQKSPEEYFSRA